MTSQDSGPSKVPPGFRFHPTDEELVNYYLRKKINMEKFDLEVIRDVDLNKLEPWDLQERCMIDSSQHANWYFFSHKDKKYPTGTRTNRATASGFWKATGRDKAVHSSFKCIGMRKTLVFYRGRAPHGIKTDWIMHEYRLEDPCKLTTTSLINNEDGWVVCKVFKKHIHHHNNSNNHNRQIKSSQDNTPLNASEEEQLSLVDTPNQDFYKQGGNGGAGGSNKVEFECKEEVENHEDNHGMSRGVQFLHLPQLESPKSSSSSMDQSLINSSSMDQSLINSSSLDQSLIISSSSRKAFSNYDHNAANQHWFNMGLMRRSRPLITSPDQGMSTTTSSLSLMVGTTSTPMDFGSDDSSLLNSMYLAATPDPWSHAFLVDSLPKDLRLYHHINTPCSDDDHGSLLSLNHPFPAPDLPPWPLLNHASTHRSSSLNDDHQQPLDDPPCLDADIWSSFTRSLTS